ncbi:uncharacterized protein [Coffea arabica]|uniref:Uncharacterized protein n=1 Tax=Coffea arabica TaxID=13443 RepID=A0ABM4X0B9_COFAR
MAYILKKLPGLVRRSAQMTAQLVSKPARRINSPGWTGSRCYSTSGFICGKFIAADGQHFSWHDHGVSSPIKRRIGGGKDTRFMQTHLTMFPKYRSKLTGFTTLHLNIVSFLRPFWLPGEFDEFCLWHIPYVSQISCVH